MDNQARKAFEQNPTKFVIVPSWPGPVAEIQASEPDEVDAVFDELFGPSDDRGPGGADAALLAAGASAAGWGIWAGGPAIATGLGLGAMGLGVILPFRWLWQRGQTRARSASARSRLRSGLPLRRDSPEITGLIDSYALIVDQPDNSPAQATEILEAAHQALTEVAALLEGRAPVVSSERAYVGARQVAFDQLLAALAKAGSRESPERRAQVAAREEIERVGASSLDRLDGLSRRLADPGHG